MALQLLPWSLTSYKHVYSGELLIVFKDIHQETFDYFIYQKEF